MSLTSASLSPIYQKSFKKVMTCDPSVVVQLLSCVQLFVTPWTAAHQASLSFTISRRLLKLMSIESVMPSNHLILCCPFLLLPSISPASGSFPMSQLFTSGGQSIGASASIDWFGLLAVQGTLKSLLQHHSSKASILWLSLLYGLAVHDYWKNHSFD